MTIVDEQQMLNLAYPFELAGVSHAVELVFVEGTRGRPYSFGEARRQIEVELAPFYLGRTTVTQAVWAKDPHKPWFSLSMAGQTDGALGSLSIISYPCAVSTSLT